MINKLIVSIPVALFSFVSFASLPVDQENLSYSTKSLDQKVAVETQEMLERRLRNEKPVVVGQITEELENQLSEDVAFQIQKVWERLLNRYPEDEAINHFSEQLVALIYGRPGQPIDTPEPDDEEPLKF